jgi:hypothetical protein
MRLALFLVPADPTAFRFKKKKFQFHDRQPGMSHANGIVVGLVGLFLIVGCCVWRANRNGLKQVSKEQFYNHIANLDKMQADQRL